MSTLPMGLDPFEVRQTLEKGCQISKLRFFNQPQNKAILQRILHQIGSQDVFGVAILL